MVFATGFEVGSNYSRRTGFEIIGRKGLTLTEEWRDGVRTAHGLSVRGFPNCFILSIAQSGFTVNFPYLLDPAQKIVKDFGAVRTPEFFVFNKDRKLVYQGNFDDSPEGKKITKHYVEDAVAAALAGKNPAVEETAPIGCMVRYVRMRPAAKK